MKSTSVYFDKNLRCRVKPTGFGNQVRLIIQKRFLFFWIDTDFWKEVKEGYWGEDVNLSGFGSPLVITDILGHKSEAYKTGTLDLDVVIYDFIGEYLQVRSEKTQVQQVVKSLGQRAAIIEGKIRASKYQPTPPEPKEPPAPDNPGYTERLMGVDRHYDLAPPKQDYRSEADDPIDLWKAPSDTVYQDFVESGICPFKAGDVVLNPFYDEEIARNWRDEAGRPYGRPYDRYEKTCLIEEVFPHKQRDMGIGIRLVTIRSRSFLTNTSVKDLLKYQH